MNAIKLQAAWETRGLLAILLWPLSLIYALLMRCRAAAYSLGLLKIKSSPVPVIVVGNLSVGGTGKTPLCAWLTRHLAEQGLRSGIVSRGHGATAHTVPHMIDPSSDRAEDVGDEPWMLAAETGVPVCVCIDRSAAVVRLVQDHEVDVVLSDDGLQHLSMQRSIELVVVDAARGFGNGWVLPAGFLRESLVRLQSVNAVVFNRGSSPGVPPPVELGDIAGLPPRMISRMPPSGSFSLELSEARSLIGQVSSPLSRFEGDSVHAVAGIGHPQRFFDGLRRAGLAVIPHPMPDHHAFSTSDVVFDDALPVMVTSKDAVKLRQLADLPATLYEVPVKLRPDDALLEVFQQVFDDRLRA